MAKQTTIITNPELTDAIADMRKEYNPESQNKVINCALRGTYLVPAIIEKDTQLVTDDNNNVKFVDKPKAKFLLIKNKEQKTFFPIFTDREELAKFKAEQKFQPVSMKFSDVANLTEKVETVEGFVINPMSHNLPFTKQMLEEIKQVLIKNKKAAEEKAAAEKAAEETTTEE